jgi:DNA polymerase-3 subunit epsilon
MIWWKRRTGADEGRWLVVDVESSGLDPQRDRLLAIAGVALHVAPGGAPQVALADSFEIVLRQDEAPVDRANILVHGIGVGAQRAGVPAAEAIAAFDAWVAGAPLVGFHAAFDEALIARATQAALGRRARHRWLDLAQVAPMVWPQVRARALDDWLAHAGIGCLERHRASADALSTAELLQQLWAALRAQGQPASWDALVKLAAQARWLPRDQRAPV